MLDDSVIRRLASWGTSTVTTSLYLDVDGRHHPRWTDVEQHADHLFRSARQQARLAGHDVQAAVEADLDAIRTWLGRGIDRSATRGVALFSCAGRGLFEAVALPFPVRDQVLVDPGPDVAQLCEVVATSWSALAVEVDRERWRVLRLESDGGVHELDVLDDRAPRTVDVEMELAGFGRHEEELAREHLRRVARVVAAEMVRRPARHLVLAGTERSVDELETYLPRSVVDRIAGRVPLPAASGTRDLVEAAREIVERAEHERRSAVLATLRQRAATTGTSVVTGLEATLDALGSEKVATLVVERSFEAPGARCEKCGLLVVRARWCPRCGGPVQRTENVVDAAIADSFLHHAVLEPVEDGSLGDLGHIGALVHKRAAMTIGGAGNA